MSQTAWLAEGGVLWGSAREGRKPVPKSRLLNENQSSAFNPPHIKLGEGCSDKRTSLLRHLWWYGFHLKQNLPVHLNPPSPNTDPESLNLSLSPSGLLPWPADLHPILGVSGPPQSAAHILPWHAPALILTYANVVLGLIVRTNCLLVSLQINISLPSNDSVVLPQSKSPCEVPGKFSRISVKASSADPPTQSVNQSLWISVELHWFALAEDLG